jgi:predicted lipoprotein with Yx(FWY)xxD motif
MASAVGIAAAGLLAAACSSGATTSAATATATPPASSPAALSSSASAAPMVTVSMHSVSGIQGKALVAGNGRALYMFQADKHGHSTCYGPCAAGWPPFIVNGKPHAEKGAKQSLVGTTRRDDGKTQATYNGHPLYFFAGDKRSHEAKGEDSKAFGGDWYVLNAHGKKTDKS